MFENGKGDHTVTANEMELIKIIRENDKPEKAAMTAIEIISEFLRQLGSSQGQAVADPPVSA